MKRRGVTLLVGAFVLVVLVFFSFFGVKVPYVDLVPGPTWDTLGTDNGKPNGTQLIQVQGATTTKSNGQLRMVTVGVEDDITLWQAVLGWLKGSDAVVPREVIYPPDQSQQQVDQQNQQDFKDSQSSAETAALRELGFPVQVTVAAVTPGSPAEGHLAKDDIVTSVNGQKVTSAQKLTSLIRAQPAGTPLSVGYTRGGVAGTTTIAATKSSDGTPRIGIQVEQKQPNPYKITFTLDNVGGPSAGMMFSLGIIDKLQPVDLTGGRRIAGTGTIDDDGNVGAIGGITQKMNAAKRDGATVFLVPSDNCAEAVANAVAGLQMVKVSTLDNALTALSDLRSGTAPPSCAR